MNKSDWLLHPVATLNRRLATDTGGLPVFPLAILFLLFFFDEFDTNAFYVLGPNIKRSFSLNDRDFALVVIVNVSVVLLLAIPVGYLGDRVKRVLLIIIGAVVAGVFSFMTGVVTTVGLLVLVRICNGFGRLVNEPIGSSLLSDYYRPDDRPRIFSNHRNAVYLGGIIGPMVAGLVATIAGWRVAFMVLIVPILAVAFVALRMKEPRRGATDDPDAAEEVEKEPPVPFREAARTLLNVRTLKRQYWAWVFIGAASIPLAVFLPLYLQRVYHLNELTRGIVVGANSFFTFLGVLMAGPWTQRWMMNGFGDPLKKAGMALAATGVGLLLVAASPFLAIALVVGFATSYVIGIFFPPFFTAQALVSPARVRSLSFSFGALFLFLGGTAFFISPLGTVSDDAGIRWGIAATVPFWIIGGLILYSAHRFVTDDTSKAFRVLSAAVSMRKQRLSAGEKSLLLCTGVDVAYDSVQVLFGVDLEIKEGEIVALLGTNGAGKSTLLKAISGLVDPIGGAVFFDGKDVTHVDGKKSAELGIVQMPGGRSVFPTLTVNECLKLAGWMYRRDPGHVKAATAKALEYFPVLVERGDTLAGNLSGGEQQMLGLAMAFISKPRLLMIDELSLGLAPAIVSQLVDIVKEIHAQGTTIILVEQSVNVALLLAQRAVFMEKGEVRFSGATAELLERGDVLRSVFLEGAASVVGVEEAGDTEGTKRARQEAKVRAPIAPDARTVLELRDVVVRFGGVRAVDEASFSLRDGEILGLIGPNGAGKTTIFDVISGFVTPVSGHVILDGVDVTSWSPDRRAIAGLGRSFQDARIFPSLTVAENIATAFERHLEVRDPVAAALGLPAVSETETDVAWKVHDLIELLGLGAFRNKFVGELSTGSRRIVDLAMSIAHRPKVLILDEPSSGIAQRETEALGPLLLRIQREVGCSMLVIEHDMPLVTSISDTMLALELGRVIASGTADEVVNHPQVVASYLGSNEQVVARSGELVTTGGGPAAAANGTTNGTTNGATATKGGPNGAAAPASPAAEGSETPAPNGNGKRQRPLKAKDK